jgi:hypothetical protein
MRRVLAGGFLGLLLIALASTAFAPTVASIPSGRIHTSAINFNLSYSDPASDVAQLWTSNNSHATTAGGAWILSPSPGEVNLIRLSSVDSGGSILLSVRVRTTIAMQANTTYDVRLYTTSDNSTYYIVRYNNGTTTLRSNHTGSAVTSLGGTTISPASTLNLVVPKSALGGITAWNIDATAQMVGMTYTYVDFIWSVPGNPGSAPAAIQGHVTDAGTGVGLAGVSIAAAGFSTATNATGYYLLPAVQGNLTITFSLTGYQTASQPVSLSLAHTATVNAQLSKVPQGLPASTWLLIAVGIIAASAIIAFVVLRRRRPSPPSE